MVATGLDSGGCMLVARLVRLLKWTTSASNECGPGTFVSERLPVLQHVSGHRWIVTFTPARLFAAHRGRRIPSNRWGVAINTRRKKYAHCRPLGNSPMQIARQNAGAQSPVGLRDQETVTGAACGGPSTTWSDPDRALACEEPRPARSEEAECSTYSNDEQRSGRGPQPPGRRGVGFETGSRRTGRASPAPTDGLRPALARIRSRVRRAHLDQSCPSARPVQLANFRYLGSRERRK
jgi:hypothetical protein